MHRNGEFDGATIWDVWRGAGGQSANTLLDDLVGGMNFTPATPTYIQMRDGVLRQAPASRNCMIWRGFASRGMGVGATMNSKSGKAESFAVPNGC